MSTAVNQLAASAFSAVNFSATISRSNGCWTTTGRLCRKTGRLRVVLRYLWS